jgi:hypothetical protein
MSLRWLRGTALDRAAGNVRLGGASVDVAHHHGRPVDQRDVAARDDLVAGDQSVQDLDRSFWDPVHHAPF